MARATHLTISTADRIRLDGRCGEDGGEESGDNEVRQEVQVSVTYALEACDTKLVRLAEAKALEVKLAHEAVWDRIGAFSSNAFSGGRNGGGRPSPCSGRRPSDEEDDYRNEEDRDDGNDGPSRAAARSPAHRPAHGRSGAGSLVHAGRLPPRERDRNPSTFPRS